MSKNHSRTRSVGLILIGLMLGAVTIAPAFANHTPKHTAKQIKKLNKKVKSLPTTSAVQQAIDAAQVTEPFNISAATGETKTLAAHGPITIKGSCAVDGANLETNVFIETTEAGTAFGGDDNDNGNIGPATPLVDRTFENPGASSAGVPDHSDGYDDQFSARAPSGPALHGTVSSIADKNAGSCKFYGSWTKVS